MNKFLFTLIVFSIWSCAGSPGAEENSSAENKEYSSPQHRERTTSVRTVMMNKTQCKLKGTQRITRKEEVLGTWKDTLLWKTQKNDTCYYGIKNVDRHISLTLNPTKTYVWQETFPDTSFSFTEYGEYFFYSDSMETILTLAKSTSPDTLFAQGDTMIATEFHLYWTNSTSILLVPPLPKENIRHYEVYEMKMAK